MKSRFSEGSVVAIMCGLAAIAFFGFMALSPGVITPSGTDQAIDTCKKKGGVPITEVQDHAVVMKDCRLEIK